QTAGQTMEMDEKMVEAMKEAAYHLSLNRLVDLKDKPYELAPLGETKVNSRPAVGVKVSSKGHKDVNLYFDRATGLLAKTETRALDFQTSTEVAEETIVLDYQERDGYKAPKRILTNHDGKKYLEAELLDYKFLDKKFDDSEFVKP